MPIKKVKNEYNRHRRLKFFIDKYYQLMFVHLKLVPGSGTALEVQGCDMWRSVFMRYSRSAMYPMYTVYPI